MSNDLESRLAALEAEVGRLAAIEEIRTLRHRYHEAINEGYYDRIPLMFTEDASLDFSYIGRTRGREKIAKFFSMTPDVLPFIKQFIHNHVVLLDGERGTGHSYMEAKTINNDKAFMVAGRYDDEYVRQDGAWKFQTMNFNAYFTVPLDEGWAQEDRLKMARKD